MSSSDSSSICDGEYEVEEIVNDRKKKYYDTKKKTYKFITEYLIKWVGYKRRSWEPEENLDNCSEMLSKYKINKRNLMRNNNSKTPLKSFKSNIEKINKNKKNIKSPLKLKNSPYLPYLSDKDDKNDDKNDDNDEEYNQEDYNEDKSDISLKSNIKNKTKKKVKKNKHKNKLIKNKEKKINKAKYNDLDFDIDIIDDGKESPIFNKINKHEFYSESTFEPYNNILENFNENSIYQQNLEKKRKRSESISDYSISIDDPFMNMKTENTSQNNSNINHIDINNSDNNNDNNNFLGISQVSIPKNENEHISLLCKLKNNNKNLFFKGTSSNLNIPKNEIINCYEKILINYLGGQTINLH